MEEITGADVVFTDDELVATLLDPRTVSCHHLSATKRRRGMDLYVEKYVTFATTAVNRTYIKDPLVMLPLKPSSPIKKKSSKIVSGIIFESGGWISDDEGCSPEKKVSMADYYGEEAKRVFRSYRKQKFNWKSIFSNLPQAENIQLDLISDLMKVNIGVIFRSLQRQDPKRLTFGLIPYMASSYLGKCMAESFAERTYRCAKDILTDGNSLLSHEKLGKVVVLRMNRRFMEQMRVKYSNISKQRFNLTLGFCSETGNSN